MSLPEEFTPEERKVLEPFFTNMDKPAFCLVNLPEVVKGAVFSRYSRSAKSLRRTLLDDFIKDKQMGFQEIVGPSTLRFSSGQASPGASALGGAVRKAEAFYDRVLVGYGDDSVAELAGAHAGVEGVSNVVTKIIEDARLTSPLEKSTRYVWFDQKENGEYLFYKEPALMGSKFAQGYLRLMNGLFDAYARLKEPMTRFIQSRFPLDEFAFHDPETGREIRAGDISDEARRKQIETAYRSTVKAQVCDVLRGLLPASTKTNMGLFADGRSFESLLTKLYSSELAEARELAASLHEELKKVIPSFVKRAGPSKYLSETRAAVKGLGGKDNLEQETRVVLDWHDPDAETEVLSAILYSVSRVPYDSLRQKVGRMSGEEKSHILKTYFGSRANRRDKPGRALENAYYRFDILADYGIYRDLQRHRMLTQERQALNVSHGWETPPEIVEAGFEKDFQGCMEEAAALFRKVEPEYPVEAQYLVPLAYRIRWYMYMNLRELYHFVELRSGKQGHPAYRRVAQEMYREVRKVHPALVEPMKFVDLNDYVLGRSDAELRAESKRDHLLKGA
jgi:thymidylate synthase ThyX